MLNYQVDLTELTKPVLIKWLAGHDNTNLITVLVVVVISSSSNNLHIPIKIRGSKARQYNND